MVDDTSRCALLTGVILKGLALRQFVHDVRVCSSCFMFAYGLVLWTESTKGLYVMRVLKCAFTDDTLIVLSSPCASVRTLNSSY